MDSAQQLFAVVRSTSPSPVRVAQSNYLRRSLCEGADQLLAAPKRRERGSLVTYSVASLRLRIFSSCEMAVLDGVAVDSSRAKTASSAEGVRQRSYEYCVA